MSTLSLIKIGQQTRNIINLVHILKRNKNWFFKLDSKIRQCSPGLNFKFNMKMK